MPNHFHGLIHMSEKSPDLSKFIQNTKRFLAYAIVKYLKEDNRADILDVNVFHARTVKGAKHKVFENRFDLRTSEALARRLRRERIETTQAGNH